MIFNSANVSKHGNTSKLFLLILNKYKFKRVKKGGVYVYEVCTIDIEKIDRNSREAPNERELNDPEINAPPDPDLPF